MRTLRTGLAILITGMAVGGWTHSGDHTYHHLDYSGASSTPSLTTTNGDPLAIQVAQVVNAFSVVPNAHGETLFPEGSLIAKVAFEDGFIRVWVEFPAELAEQMNWFKCETALEIIRFNSQIDERLQGIEIFARFVGDEEWVPISELFPEPTPVFDTSTDDNFEAFGPGPQPTIVDEPSLTIGGQGPQGTSTPQIGSLTGRTVYLGAGHGWTWSGSSWFLQRPLLLSMNEDHGNIDQILMTAQYLLNAGATVVPTRGIGNQLNEVIVDNPAAAFSGSWLDSSNASYYGSGVPYRYIDATPTETATATYTPNIPEAGFYPVYCWANYGSDRVSGQLYRVKHTGGESELRVNHRRVGRGWVWLGNYYFEAGSHPETGSVVISNAAPTSGNTSGVIIADAIRFGNGMGDINRGGGISGYARETEASRYWVEASAGTAVPTGTWDLGGFSDSSDNVGTPPRMAAQMRRDDGQGYNGDIYLGYHSNAANSVARGNVALYRTSSVPTNQQAFAILVADEQDRDCLLEDEHWEHNWVDRASPTLAGSYGEISSTNLNGEMCGTIIEVAFHDTPADADLLRDPKFRAVCARSHTQAIIQYFNQFDGGSLAYAPEPPFRVRAQSLGNGQVRVAWNPGDIGQPGGDAPTGYRVYTSPDGLNFGLHSSTSATSATIDLPGGVVTYLRVVATNAGGVSMPSEVLAVKTAPSRISMVLVVNGYDRIDRFNNVEEYPNNATDDENERIHLRQNNSYDYVRQHASALGDLGVYIDSCANEAVINGDISLDAYELVVWICGEETSGDETLSASEQTILSNYLNGGGHVMVSGAEVGWDLDAQGSTGDRNFYNQMLGADYVSDDSNSYTVQGTPLTPFETLFFTYGSNNLPYQVDFPDAITPTGGAFEVLRYGNGQSAGVFLDRRGTGGGTALTLGFPFETIDDPQDRAEFMFSLINMLGLNWSMPGGFATQ